MKNSVQHFFLIQTEIKSAADISATLMAMWCVNLLFKSNSEKGVQKMGF